MEHCACIVELKEMDLLSKPSPKSCNYLSRGHEPQCPSLLRSKLFDTCKDLTPFFVDSQEISPVFTVFSTWKAAFFFKWQLTSKWIHSCCFLLNWSDTQCFVKMSDFFLLGRLGVNVVIFKCVLVGSVVFSLSCKQGWALLWLSQHG